MLNTIKKNHKELLFGFFVAVALIIISNFNFFGVLDILDKSSSNVNIGAAFTPLAPSNPITGDISNPTNFMGLLNSIFRWGIAVAVTLAIIMITVGGLQYMTTDAISGKKDGKEKIKAAFAGLLLALSGWLILNTINPQIVKTRIDLRNIEADLQDNTMPPYRQDPNAMPDLPWSPTDRQDFLIFGTQLSSERSTTGDLNFTTYWDGDTNTNQRRGNSNNLLRPGSIALSPDLIARLGNPPVGSEIFVNGRSVGFFEDTTGRRTPSGTPIVNTIDVYDPDRRIGPILRKINNGDYNITVGSARRQITNP